MSEVLKGFKGFNKGLICRGKKYKENTVFEEEEAILCEKGMHFCVNPFDVLDFYDIFDSNGDFNEFAEVEALDNAVTNDSKKYCTTKLKIGAKLSFSGFVKACVDFVVEKTKYEKDSSGDSAQIGSSGDYAKIGSSGDYAQIGSSGDYAKIGSSGDSAQIGSSGDYAVICCAGHGSKVKAKKGSWITLSEWKYSNEKKRYIPVCVKTEQVDGEKIKEDTLYTLQDGEFVEVSE